jgi:peptidoglycan/xylan/chitin deacetylase (PgdA/CDA1 family)
LGDGLASIATQLKGRQAPGLVVTYFHAIHEDDATAHAGPVLPFQPLTVRNLAGFIDILLEFGFKFVLASDIAAGLEPDQAYLCLTFDDGYANSLRVLPVLNEFDVPATFFVTTDPIGTGAAFWWDALYRIRKRQGVDTEAVLDEIEGLKERAHHDIVAHVEALGTPAAFRPEGDEDRPLTLEELRRLATDPLAEIGNHTANHAVLTLLDDDAIRATIRRAQDFLEDALGKPPTSIAYPNGNADRRVARIAREIGLSIGFSAGNDLTPRLTDIEDPYLVPRMWIPGGDSLVPDALRLATGNPI